MKKQVVAGTAKFLNWFRPQLDGVVDPPATVVPEVPVPEPEDPIMPRVRELVLSVEPLPVSGEHKRHTVYARLIKDFPDRRKRDLGFAIEKVLQEPDVKRNI